MKDKPDESGSPEEIKKLNGARILFKGCPLCNSENLKMIGAANCTQHPLYHPLLPDHINWRRCQVCAHVFTDGYFSDEATSIIFQNTNTNQSPGKDFEHHRKLSAPIIEKVSEHIQGGRWLDVGFGNGSLLFTAQEWGFQSVGLDLRSSSVDAMKALGFEAHCIELENFKPDKTFSVISMADVLEHVPFPKRFLAHALSLLADDGILFLSMPAFDSPAWRLLDKARKNPYWAELEHYHNFSRTRLYELLDEVGFVPIRYSISDRYRLGMEVIAKPRRPRSPLSPPAEIKPDAANQRLFEAARLHHQGLFDAAKTLYEQVLDDNPASFDALHMSAVMAFQTGKMAEAKTYFSRALAVGSSFAALHFNYALFLQTIGKPEEALQSFQLAIALQPDHVDAFHHSGLLFQQLGKLDEALAAFQKAIVLSPDFSSAYFNYAVALNKAGWSKEALVHYKRVIAIDNNNYEACNNSGIILADLRQFEEAQEFYKNAISIRPYHPDAQNNLANILQATKQFTEAVEAYQRAIHINPDSVFAYNNLSTALLHLRRFDEALPGFEKALALKPELDWLAGTALHIKMLLSQWNDLHHICTKIKNDILANRKVTPCFPIIGLFDDPELQLINARLYAETHVQKRALLPATPNLSSREKIVVAYFSADFHEHATSYLMIDMFENHDRKKFEFVAFSFGPDKRDTMRARLVACFDRFIDVRFKSDQEIAEIARDMKIDIAIDLKGFTEHSRPGIFAHRCAPIQVNYIGYPGTMGAKYIDYIIADKTLIPRDKQAFYSEKIVYLPGSYQVNDSKRKISKKIFKKSDFGLPAKSFVFCCFNNSFKIMPQTFDSWMQILESVEDSVLWLLEHNPTSSRNLQDEAMKRGVSPHRLIFCQKMPLAEHLARHRCADLFLDTLPCNAYTTASDSLWAGLPVLTLMGGSFAGRVSASLLKAIQLPELITTSVEEYQRLAIRLASHPAEMKSLKQKLATNRLTSDLFDSPRYIRNVQTAYVAMHERYKSGLQPDHIYIEDNRA